jgi:hypothetical protein
MDPKLVKPSLCIMLDFLAATGQMSHLGAYCLRDRAAAPLLLPKATLGTVTQS